MPSASFARPNSPVGGSKIPSKLVLPLLGNGWSNVRQFRQRPPGGSGQLTWTQPQRIAALVDGLVELLDELGPTEFVFNPMLNRVAKLFDQWAAGVADAFDTKFGEL